MAINSNLNEPPTRGQPPNRGQKLCSQSVLYSEVPLYPSRHAGFLLGSKRIQINVCICIIVDMNDHVIEAAKIQNRVRMCAWRVHRRGGRLVYPRADKGDLPKKGCSGCQVSPKKKPCTTAVFRCHVCSPAARPSNYQQCSIVSSLVSAIKQLSDKKLNMHGGLMGGSSRL